ncbi:MAG: DUF4428 domain-containing protein [Thermoplasmata archaeon]
MANEKANEVAKINCAICGKELKLSGDAVIRFVNGAAICSECYAKITNLDKIETKQDKKDIV